MDKYNEIVKKENEKAAKRAGMDVEDYEEKEKQDLKE